MIRPWTTGAFGLAGDRRHVRLPRIGVVRTCEPTRKLARKIETAGLVLVHRSGTRVRYQLGIDLLSALYR